MSRIIFLLCVLIKTISSENELCSALNDKLNQYGIQITNIRRDFLGLRICEDLIDDLCCPQTHEEDFQNVTTMELNHLFEFYSKDFYQSLHHTIRQLNETIHQLIEYSRNETHEILQTTFAISYRSSIDIFYNQFLEINSRNYQHEIKHLVEEFFRNLLRMNFEEHHSIKPSRQSAYLTCLWRNHPFGNRPNLLAKKLEIYWRKVSHLHELLKLTIELIQVISTSVTTDYHCIDSYMQLSFCNLCSGRKQLPCQSNCINVIESCLVNVTLINEIWMKLIDSLENLSYFNGIEKVFFSIGSSISDALMNFFHSNEINNKDIIDQCGLMNLRKEILSHQQHEHSNENQHSFSLSLFDQFFITMKNLFEHHRSFWFQLPREICRSNEHSSSSENQLCWTGHSLSQDQKESMKIHYDKPLSLRLQWILKEMKEKSQMLGNEQQQLLNLPTKNTHLFNLTDDLDDYPTDEEFDYSDDAYEDLTDRLTSKISTTIRSTTISSTDEINTISYDDYGESDVYTDDEWNETLTRQKVISPPSPPPTTTSFRIPSYHQRQPVIWNILIDKEISKSFNSSSTSSWNCSYLFLILLVFLI